jgi:ATP-dependent helicase/nuclease subunit B
VLENLFLDIRQSERAISEISDGELEAMLEKSAESFVNETLPEESSKRRTEILIKRLKSFMRPIALGLCEELRGCKFVPEFFELKIGGEDENSPRPVTFTDKNGKRTMIWGSVDRVDAYKSGNDVYVRVIDYKTGKKSFSPSDISEGRNLQMFLYLKAIAETDNENLKKRLGVGEGGRIIPAGVIYIQTDMSEVKIDKNDKALAEEARREAQKRRGMLLNDAESISAMNRDYIPIK